MDTKKRPNFCQDNNIILQKFTWHKFTMSEKTIENYGKSFLVLILPISFLIVFLVNTWRILLLVLLLVMGLNLWQQNRWEKWCEQVNPLFYQLIQENQGKITPIDLALKGNFSGNEAKRYLDRKAKEFGASLLDSENESPSYYFINASILSDILHSSDPVEKLRPRPVTAEVRSLLAPPPPIPQEKQQEEEALDESLPEVTVKATHEAVTKQLEEQLVFGSLIQSELAKRLGVYSSTVYKRRNDPDFSEWSRSRDPDGIAWSYSRKSREFFPLEE
jgi:thiol-disulfide isomerase/thioredoxin